VHPDRSDRIFHDYPNSYNYQIRPAVNRVQHPIAIEFRQRPQSTAGLRHKGESLCKNHPEQKESKQ